MKAQVKVNGSLVAIFYQFYEETQSQMHQRILNTIIYRYGMCNIDIQWI
jgi:hypothetical protein